jgi:energy-coupling factor transporter ATP-binding protein EcfA2
MVDILVWTIDPELGRVDLARPLSESGTGIGQVLAILYVALTAIRPQVVIVDEPQSFLHPGAIRKLIEVLKVQSKHQFIIATHSPTVITSANPTTISLVRSKSGQSEIEHIDVKKTKTMATYLNEIGARLSDVFGADNVLWAEGATEELCFPIILEKIAKKPLMGTAILGVRQVGDLEGRDAERVFDIYSRLSQGTSLLPPAIGFLFDAESRTKAQQTDLRRKSRNQVDFLPRRMFENFLLVPEAIAAVTNTIDGFRSTPVRVEEIREFIQTKLKDRTYVDPLGNGSGEAGDWTTRIDGARVLSEMFTSLSETRVTYRKTEHSVALVEWIVENKPEALQEIADILVRLLDTKTTRG